MKRGSCWRFLGYMAYSYVFGFPNLQYSYVFPGSQTYNVIGLNFPTTELWHLPLPHDANYGLPGLKSLHSLSKNTSQIIPVNKKWYLLLLLLLLLIICYYYYQHQYQIIPYCTPIFFCPIVEKKHMFGSTTVRAVTMAPGRLGRPAPVPQACGGTRRCTLQVNLATDL